MNPETIVKSFIEDYFRWNEESFARSEKIRTLYEAALSSIGAEYPPRIEKITDMSRFLQIQIKNSAEHTELMREISENYKILIKKYCRPDQPFYAPAFGSDSSHHPENEEIIAVEITGEKAVVKTKRTEHLDFTELVSDYEFYLIRESGQWYLEQIYYVNEEGRYEAL